MSESKPRNVQDTLVRLSEGKQDEELIFDPRSGRLMTVGRDHQLVRDADAIPATEMVREGFFASARRDGESHQ